MKSIVKGKIVEKIYSVDCEYSKPQNEGEEQYLVRKPKLKMKERITYRDICEFEGDFIYNRGYWNSTNSINISEDEEVDVVRTKFRADLNEQHIFVDKVLEETEINKESAEQELAGILKIWNKQIIGKDEKLLAYCNLHKLVIEDTDIDELKKVVYGKNVINASDFNFLLKSKCEELSQQIGMTKQQITMAKYNL